MNNANKCQLKKNGHIANICHLFDILAKPYAYVFGKKCLPTMGDFSSLC